jgi:uncharacterized coiled-coil DUF342 family protein
MKIKAFNAVLGSVATLGILVAAGQAAQAGSMHNGWNYSIDSFNDGTGGSLANGSGFHSGDNSRFEMYGMAFRETKDRVYFAINSNLSIGGDTYGNALNGKISYGDLLLDFSNKGNFNQANGNLYGVRFDAENDTRFRDRILSSDELKPLRDMQVKLREQESKLATQQAARNKTQQLIATTEAAKTKELARGVTYEQTQRAAIATEQTKGAQKVASLKQDLQGQQTRLSQINQEVSDRQARVTQIDQELSAQRTQLTKIASDLRTEEGKLASLDQSIRLESNAVRKQALINQRSGIVTTINNLKSNQTTVQAKINSLTTERSGHTTKINSLSTERTAVQNKINGLNTSISATENLVKQNVTNLEASIKTEQAKVAQNVLRMDAEIAKQKDLLLPIDSSIATLNAESQISRDAIQKMDGFNPALGLYSNVTASSVTTINAGYSSHKQHTDTVANVLKGVDSLGDLAASNTYFNQNEAAKNVMGAGKFRGNIEMISDMSNFQGLDFGNFNAKGIKTFGFAIDKSMLPKGDFVASLFAECGNDGIVLKGRIPEPSALLGLTAVGLLATRRVRRRAEINV